MTTDRSSTGTQLSDWWHRTFVDLAQQLQWSYLPPLMVYFAAGVSGLTSVVGAFFLKDYLDLSASFVAGLAFWKVVPAPVFGTNEVTDRMDQAKRQTRKRSRCNILIVGLLG